MHRNIKRWGLITPILDQQYEYNLTAVCDKGVNKATTLPVSLLASMMETSLVLLLHADSTSSTSSIPSFSATSVKQI